MASHISHRLALGATADHIAVQPLTEVFGGHEMQKLTCLNCLKQST